MLPLPLPLPRPRTARRRLGGPRAWGWLLERPRRRRGAVGRGSRRSVSSVRAWSTCSLFVWYLIWDSSNSGCSRVFEVTRKDRMPDGIFYGAPPGLVRGAAMNELGASRGAWRHAQLRCFEGFTVACKPTDLPQLFILNLYRVIYIYLHSVSSPPAALRRQKAHNKGGK